MCGIFGFAVSNDLKISRATLNAVLKELFLLAETRGKEAAGIAFLTDQTIHTYKDRQSASRFIRDGGYRNLLKAMSNNDAGHRLIAMIGHSRMVTNGAQEIHDNNQPVVGADFVGIHNGIICNDAALWSKHASMQRKFQVDTEVFFTLISQFQREGVGFGQAVAQTFAEIEGTASIAGFYADLDGFFLATNNGSLYYLVDSDKKTFAFVSEKYMAECFRAVDVMRTLAGKLTIHHLEPGRGLLVDFEDLTATEFSLSAGPYPESSRRDKPRRIEDLRPQREQQAKLSAPHFLSAGAIRELEAGFEEGATRRARLTRCSRCLLPSTIPFIAYDETGLCNYCRNYQKLEFHGRDALLDALAPYRKKNGAPECIVGLSGGRDSCYALHYVVRELGLNAVAYTYDWGMVTDLARRNISRMCACLGVEHVLISADIPRKRENIRKNVRAWLKRPSLGMVPLFMAGDKQYFHYAQQLKRQMGIPVVVLGENMLERTDFKTGFAGIRPHFDKKHVYTLRASQKLALAAYYAHEFLLNPAYVNRSLLDSLWAFTSYYFVERAYLNLYKYIPWDEDSISSTLIREYNWETAGDTKSTWRIGDGTASFYNYIYYVMAGFSENDTFRSNQVREGILSRTAAAELVERDNRPRWETMQWYCNTIGVDFREAVSAINRAHKLY
jgi:asparagine synthetase B (glutamine-hydrolysing)